MNNTCEICGEELEKYEEDLLDCGHYACNSCAYQDKDELTCCFNCKKFND